MMEKDVDYSNKVTALTVCNDAAINEFLAKKYDKIRRRKSTVTISTEEARRMGYNEGKNTDIYKPISTNKKKCYIEC